VQLSFLDIRSWILDKPFSCFAEDHREAEQGGDHGPDVGEGAVLDEPALLPEPRGRGEHEARRRRAPPAQHAAPGLAGELVQMKWGGSGSVKGGHKTCFAFLGAGVVEISDHYMIGLDNVSIW
jgi:hypothetical protein